MARTRGYAAPGRGWQEGKQAEGVRTTSQAWTASGLVWSLCAVGVFVYGVEHWRRGAAARATRTEAQRFVALSGCLLGPDALARVYQAHEVRQRLRALAMETPLALAPTWIDPCVPLARDLALEGARVDVTRTVTAAPTQVGRRARELALQVARVGLVWQVRGGDPEVDMDTLAELLVRTAAELELAGVPLPRTGRVEPTPGAPVAPLPTLLPRPTLLDLPGLEPLPLGTPRRFLVGTPLPALAAVRVGSAGVWVEPRGNTEARAWRVRSQGLVRILPEDGRADGLAPVLLDGADTVLGLGRVAAPPPRTPNAAVSLDALAADQALWLAESVRGNAPVLARLPVARNEPATALRLAPPTPAFATPRGSVTPEEEVALGGDGRQVFVAYTVHSAATVSEVSVLRAPTRARPVVSPVPFGSGPWRLAGARPSLSFCATRDGLWLLAAGRDRWRIGRVTAEGVEDVWRTAAPASGGALDVAVTVRCNAAAMLVHGAVRPRHNPVVRCAGARCGGVAPWVPPHPNDLPAYTTAGPDGRRVTHPEWPWRVVALDDGSLLAARAVGTVCAVSRWTPGAAAWGPERVVLDAAATEHGVTVQSLELYADGGRALLVVALPTGLALLGSDDGGRSWAPPATTRGVRGARGAAIVAATGRRW